MTLAQVTGALAAVDADERDRLRMALVIARGAQAEPKDYRRLLQDLGASHG